MKEIIALAKIKTLLNNHYQNIGREVEDINEVRKELIEDIDNVLRKVKIPSKYLIVEQYEEEE